MSRGNPKPHTLRGEALIQARLTPETWRLEIVADSVVNEVVKERAMIAKPLTMADGTALDLPALLELGRKHGVKFLKAMQCNNIPGPLGQGLWEGVPLREVLRLRPDEQRAARLLLGLPQPRPQHMFRSSLSYTEVLDSPPGELPPFVAYRLNGEPIPLERGGPVRMVVPWAHGFKSIKWLQQIVLTNDYRANDTYAGEQRPDSTSRPRPTSIPSPTPSRPDSRRSSAGWRSRDLRPATSRDLGASGGGRGSELPTTIRRGNRRAGSSRRVEPARRTGVGFSAGVWSKEVLGFDPQTGRPASWPLRYSIVSSYPRSLGSRAADMKYGPARSI